MFSGIPVQSVSRVYQFSEFLAYTSSVSSSRIPVHVSRRRSSPADGLSAPSGNCTSGWYCSGAAYMSAPTSPTTNVTFDPTCSCPDSNHTGGRCWPGTYCPPGAYYPLGCEFGYYCTQYGLPAPQGQCDAGFYCDGNATRPDPPQRRCLPGHYCPRGSGTPTPCPEGTLSTSWSEENETACVACTAGQYCSGSANTAVTGPCSPHYYCPPGQTNPAPPEFNCTVGNYCPGETPLPVPCPPGAYQDEALQSSCKDCPPGRYVDHRVLIK